MLPSVVSQMFVKCVFFQIVIQETQDVSQHPSMESLTGDAAHLHPGHPYDGHRRSPSLR
jgi:hypothetical protein